MAKWQSVSMPFLQHSQGSVQSVSKSGEASRSLAKKGLQAASQGDLEEISLKITHCRLLPNPSQGSPLRKAQTVQGD